MTPASDVIAPERAGTLAGLFRERVRLSPEHPAYRHFDAQLGAWRDTTWREMALEIARWQAALAAEPLRPGDRVAVMLPNCREWVMLDQAALGLGLVIVPLYCKDRPENAAYILRHSGARLLLLEDVEQWRLLEPVHGELDGLVRLLTVQPLGDAPPDPRIIPLDHWLPRGDAELRVHECAPDSLATLVYTSGTTGRPKGAMLSHRNLLWNASSCLQSVPALPGDLFLSFLPLSHALERTAGYYLPMMAGATVAFARSIPQLAEDFLVVRPTVLISVPRIYERLAARIRAELEHKPSAAQRLFQLAVAVGWQRFEYAQGRAPARLGLLLWPLLDALVARRVRARLGGRLRLAVSGGAPLALPVARQLIGLGVPLLQGYGLTEASPVLAVNRPGDNDPAGVGPPLEEVELRLGEADELLARSPGLMAGYWQDPAASARAVDPEGWLHTGDQARLAHGHVYITGRLKEIIVLATGQKVPPADMEMAIGTDPLVEQTMVIGDGQPYLSAFVVVNREAWRAFAAALGLKPDGPKSLQEPPAEQALLERIGAALHRFPGYAQVRRAALLWEPWTVEEGLLTPTLKLRRERILAHHAAQVEELYRGHN
jgi:long-chain acyl-CoA synthetase